MTLPLWNLKHLNRTSATPFSAIHLSFVAMLRWIHIIGQYCCALVKRIDVNSGYSDTV